MTNIENVPTEYVTATSAPMDGHWDRPEMAFRVLSWVERGAKDTEAPAYLSGFSIERQEAFADLVRNGLLIERAYVGGENDGLRTVQITALGWERLRAAWEAAALIVVG